MNSRSFVLRSVFALCGAFALTADAQPSTPLSAITLSRYHVHRAEPRDTLEKIAARYLIAKHHWSALQRLNGIKDPNRISIGTAIKIPVELMRTEPAPAKILHTAGKVSVGTDAATKGATIREGERVKTGDDGFVTLQLADGSTLSLQSQSSMRLETTRQFANTGGVTDAVVRLESGRVETAVAKQRGPAARYEIRTPTSNMGVRGTQFRVGADATGKIAQSEVLEGLVGVGSNAPGANAAAALALAAGFGTTVEAGKPPSPPVKLLPPPIVKDLPANLATADMALTIPPLDKAVAYRTQVAGDAAFTTILADARTTKPEFSFSNLPDGKLFLRVRGIDAAGLEGADASTVVTIKARPFAPMLTTPANGATQSSGRVEMAWNSAPEAKSYRAQVATDENFSKPVVDVVGDKTSLALASALVSGRYFWRVATTDAKGESGPWGKAFTFTVRAERPTLREKRGVGSVDLNLPDPTRSYQVQISRDERFANLVTDEAAKAGIVKFDSLPVNTYFVRVREAAGAGATIPKDEGWSDTYLLEVYPAGWWLQSVGPARRK